MNTYAALHDAAGSALRAWMRAKGARVHRLTTEEDLPLSSAYVTAVSLLRDAPELSFRELERMVAGASTGMTNPETYEPVDAQDVLHALRSIRPKPYASGTAAVSVYHATDAETAAMLRTRGYVPETKGRSRGEFAPGKGLDAGLYVGASPRAVESYGRVTLEVEVPRAWLTVPTELAQLGERDPLRALQEHDGAVLFHALPPEAFRDAAVDTVHIVFTPPAGLFVVGVTPLTGRKVRAAKLGFAPTADSGVWLQDGSEGKTSPEGAVIPSSRSASMLPGIPP